MADGDIPLFELNPAIDRDAARKEFAAHGRTQIRDLLTPETAKAIQDILATQTRWGLAWQAGSDGPHGLRDSDVAAMTPADKQAIGQKLGSAMQGEDYAFFYSQYRMLDAYLGKWDEGGPHDLLVEHLNAEPMLGLVREVSGFDDIMKADAQATLYGAGQFLAVHDDSHPAEGRKVAYVLNLSRDDWRPDWGGYLLFYDEEGDVVAGFRPRFNALNLFAVPQRHSVTYVPPFAPIGRFAITGWFRNK